MYGCVGEKAKNLGVHKRCLHLFAILTAAAFSPPSVLCTEIVGLVLIFLVLQVEEEEGMKFTGFNLNEERETG
jgi:hypothetical protein